MNAVEKTTSKSPWGLILVLGILAAVGPLSIDMYLPALPQISRDLNAAEGAAQFTLSIFLIGVSVGQLIYGAISDRFGRKRPLLVGMGLYVIASVGCAIAWSVNSLVEWRLVMALGGSAGMGLSRAIVRDSFGVREAADAFSMLTLVMGAAPILAPVLGGQMLLFTGWRGIFWMLSVFGVLIWLVVCFFLRESLPRERRVKITIPEALMRYKGLLFDRRFMGYALVLALSAAVGFTYVTCAAHVFIDLNGISPQMFTAFFGINAMGMIGASQVNRFLLRHFTSYQILTKVLIAMSLAGILFVIHGVSGLGGFPVLVGLLFTLQTLTGLAGPNATALALAPFARAAGSASALMGTMQFGLGGIVGAVAGIFSQNSALSMCVVQASCAIGSLLVLRFIAVRENELLSD